MKLDAWGNVQQEYNPQGIHQAIRLPGQHHDRETGLYYNRHRYYDPVVGSYINQDPIGLVGGTNAYGYVRNLPTSLADPLGLEPGTMAQRGYLSNNRKSYPGLLGEDSNGVILFDEGSKDFHSYNTRNSCQKITSGCTLKNVSEGLMRYPAPSVGDTHEKYGTRAGQDKKEEIMDLHNNQQGRKCSLLAKTQEDCENGCQSGIENGDLWFIDKNSGMPTTTKD